MALPSYTYRCENGTCPNHFEFTVEASIKDDGLSNCPRCGCKVNRVFKSSPMVKWNCSGNCGTTKHS